MTKEFLCAQIVWVAIKILDRSKKFAIIKNFFFYSSDSIMLDSQLILLLQMLWL